MKRVFRKVGLSLPTHGSADHVLDIMAFRGIDIGDWIQVVEPDKEDTQLVDVRMEHNDHELVAFVAD